MAKRFKVSVRRRKTPMSISLEPELLVRLRAKAKLEDIPVSAAVRKGIKLYLDPIAAPAPETQVSSG